MDMLYAFAAGVVATYGVMRWAVFMGWYAKNVPAINAAVSTVKADASAAATVAQTAAKKV